MRLRERFVCYYFDGVERKGDLGVIYMIGMGRNCLSFAYLGVR